MSRATRIQRIIALKRLDEMLAARQLLTARQQLNRGQQVHADLVNYNAHYEQRGEQASTRRNAGSLQRDRLFSEQLGKAITQQEAALVLQDQQVQQENHVWLQKRTRSLATEALLEKVKSAEQHRSDQISAKEMDELAQRTQRSRSK